jgi:hypothetical protein
MSHSNFVVCEVDSREMIIAVKEALIKYDRLLACRRFGHKARNGTTTG